MSDAPAGCPSVLRWRGGRSSTLHLALPTARQGPHRVCWSPGSWGCTGTPVPVLSTVCLSDVPDLTGQVVTEEPQCRWEFQGEGGEPVNTRCQVVRVVRGWVIVIVMQAIPAVRSVAWEKEAPLCLAGYMGGCWVGYFGSCGDPGPRCLRRCQTLWVLRYTRLGMVPPGYRCLATFLLKGSDCPEGVDRVQ